MLSELDLTLSTAKKEYKDEIEALSMRLSELSRKAKELSIPVVIIFEGWSAAGKGTLLNRLLLPIDPRLFTVYTVGEPTEDEALRPFLWRFWVKLPPKGRIAIFVKSWYKQVLIGKVEKLVKKNAWMRSYQDINNLEAMLTDSGAVIIKYWLHISKDQQKKRFNKLESEKSTAWRVDKDDWAQNKKYEKYLSAAEDMIAKTGTHYAPWTIVEAHDANFAALKIFKTTISALEKKINGITAPKPVEVIDTAVSAASPLVLPVTEGSILNRVDLTKTIPKEQYSERLKIFQTKVRDIEHELYVRRIPLIIVYEGWDAAGKGGNIKRLTETMDPRGYDVEPVAAPNDIERLHHYLWRFWISVPKAGHITIFDRSWYGRVLVERVEGFCSELDWQKAYKEINDMEEQFHFFGAIVVKFWLHVSKDEQLRRFKEREETPYKNWKITEEDYRNREKWDQYYSAVDEMLRKTSTGYAPWTIVESDCKYWARLKALETVIQRAEERFNK